MGKVSEQRYYWLKLKKDFFKRHDIRIVESMKNGKDYLLFYLKLLLESVDHNGALRFNDAIPYNEDMLSTITNTNIDIVRSAMKIFIDLNMIEVMDDETIYMSEIGKMLGSESYWAEKKRLQRDIKIGHCPTDVQALSNVSKEEIDIELDKDKELDSNPPLSPVGKPRKKSKSNKPDTPTEKTKFGTCVFMTNAEYQALIGRVQLGSEEAVKRCIEILDNYKVSTGKTYKDDYRAILSWVIGRYMEEKARELRFNKASANSQAKITGSEKIVNMGKAGDSGAGASDSGEKPVANAGGFDPYKYGKTV